METARPATAAPRNRPESVTEWPKSTLYDETESETADPGPDSPASAAGIESSPSPTNNARGTRIRASFVEEDVDVPARLIPIFDALGTVPRAGVHGRCARSCCPSPAPTPR